ncbi:hypothetical protein [Aestuariivirga sp.]|uniref:hypothetical protein n=1 Tax=Aestuariivirga sp. TaxID=2650926 RepID=UPI0039E537B6
MLVLFPVNLAAEFYLQSFGAAFDPQHLTPGQAAVLMAVAIAGTIALASIAVNWHRYVLLDEIPDGRRLRLDATVWRYIGNSLLILLILGLVWVAILIAATFLAAILNTIIGRTAGAVLATIVVLAFAVLVAAFYRLSVKLPAIALGRQDYRFQNAWADTTGNNARLIGLVLLICLAAIAMLAINMVIRLALLSFPGVAGTVVAIAVNLVIQWILTILLVTTLTSLYGFFGEKRDF